MRLGGTARTTPEAQSLAAEALQRGPDNEESQGPEWDMQNRQSQPYDPNPSLLVACRNCNTTVTPLWRRDEAGHPICNACGMSVPGSLSLHWIDRCCRAVSQASWLTPSRRNEEINYQKKETSRPRISRCSDSTRLFHLTPACICLAWFAFTTAITSTGADPER